MTDLGPLHITGNLIINNNAVVTLTGTVYVNGYFEIVNNASVIGPGVICAEGDISIQNCSTPAGLPVFMTLSDILCKNNSYVEAALYAPNGEVSLEENSSVYGAVVASSIATDNNFDITHAPELTGGSGLPECGCS